MAYFAGVDLAQFPNLYKWWQRINARPAVQKGVAVPSEPKITNDKYQQRLKDEPEFAQQEKELKEIMQKAKEQYNYKFSAP